MRSKIPLFLLAAAITAEVALAAGDSDPGGRRVLGGVHKQSAAEVDRVTQPSKTERKGEAFFLKGLDGGGHSLEDWKGKVIVLNFWATWCSPCLYEIPDLVAYQEQYGTQGLQIVGVGLDEEKKLRNVQRTLEINYPILIADPARNSGMMTSWGNSSGIVPYTVVIGRDGRVVYTHHGLINLETFNENILPLLTKAGAS